MSNLIQPLVEALLYYLKGMAVRTNKLFKQLILAVSLCSYTLSSFADTPASSTTATSDDLCTASGYTLGF
jgi:hypothetical protein